MSLKSRIGFNVASGFLLSAACQATEPQTKPGSPPAAQPRSGAATSSAPAKIKLADSTPEDALRTFMLAILAQDEAAVRAVTLPNPDFDWLLKSQPAPPQVIKDATAQFGRLPMKRLQRGEKVALPQGKQYVVTTSEVGEDRAVLLPQGAPVPTRLQRVAGHWKVAADPFIAARKAADAAKKKPMPKKTPAKG
jgi:hypothetical protein